jgi:hypothetical protein
MLVHQRHELSLPRVAGIVALMLQKNPALNNAMPGWQADQSSKLGCWFA